MSLLLVAFMLAMLLMGVPGLRAAYADTLLAPQLRAPSNGATLSTVGPIALRWESLPGVRQYHLRMSPHGNDGPGIDVIVADPRLVGQSMYAVDAPVRGTGGYLLLPGMTYTWQVRLTDSLLPVGPDDPGWGAWSEAWQFRTPLPTPGSLTPVQPGEAGTVSGEMARLQWADVATSIFYYEIQVSLDRQFRTGDDAVASVWWNLVHGGVSTPLNSWETPPLEPGKVYYWRVRPRVQGDGQPVEWGPVWRFTSALPPMAVLGQEALDGINKERTSRGLSALAVNDLLAKAALAHSQDMAARETMSHTGSDGTDPGQRVTRAGYTWRAYGEIVAAGYTLAPEVVAGWMNSRTHREVILTAELREFGIGIARSATGRLYWTVNFGTR